MAKTVNSLNLPGVVGVEHSVERLAAVEEAKRTGQAFQSVGANGHDIVDREKLRAAVETASNDGVTEESYPLPEYLSLLQAGVESTQAVNILKAASHSQYSKEIVEAQIDAALADAEKLRDDPEYYAKRIAENNQALAQAHSDLTNAFIGRVSTEENTWMEEVRALGPEDAHSPHPVTALGRAAEVTDVSESFAKDELQAKDRIIYGEDVFAEQAVLPRDAAPTDDRALDPALTDDFTRTNEPVREEEEPDPEPAQAQRVTTADEPRQVSSPKEAKADVKESRKEDEKKSDEGETKRRSSKSDSKE